MCPLWLKLLTLSLREREKERKKTAYFFWHTEPEKLEDWTWMVGFTGQPEQDFSRHEPLSFSILSTNLFRLCPTNPLYPVKISVLNLSQANQPGRKPWQKCYISESSRTSTALTSRSSCYIQHNSLFWQARLRNQSKESIWWELLPSVWPLGLIT